MLPTSTAPRLIHRGGKTITADIRVRLINAHQDGVSYKRMENLFGVKKDTAYRICQGFSTSGSREIFSGSWKVGFLLNFTDYVTTVNL